MHILFDGGLTTHRLGSPTEASIIEFCPLIRSYCSSRVEKVVRVVFVLNLEQFVVISTKEGVLEIGLAEVSLRNES
jgi:hypothetical protein